MGLLALGVFALVCTRVARSPEPKTEEHVASAAADTAIVYWTCGMHPDVRVTPEAYAAGETQCPICKMDLIPVRKGGATGEADVTVALSPAEQRLVSVRTFAAAYLPLHHEIRAVGIIGYDERNVAHISARVPGRVDKLYVSFSGEPVARGDPLVLIYSPALVSAQQEYLLALATLERVKDSPVEEARESARTLVESSRNRLLLWGVTEAQIENLERTGQTDTQLTIYSPQSGTVIEKHILEGEYVKEGQMLYRIADLSNLWVMADVYEYEIPWLANGQDAEVTTSAYPGETFNGKVSFIDPYMQGKTRSLKVRIDLANPDGKLKPDMYADVLLKRSVGRNDSSLAIPKTAVLDVGRRKLVYVDKGDGNFEQREVEVSSEAEAVVAGESQRFYPVISGVAEGEKVVVNANFLMDSQTQLTGQAAGAYGGALETSEPGDSDH
jgi:Cu(I)/Ag(I) efflux system membrane fusion protein